MPKITTYEYNAETIAHLQSKVQKDEITLGNEATITGHESLPLGTYRGVTTGKWQEKKQTGAFAHLPTTVNAEITIQHEGKPLPCWVKMTQSLFTQFAPGISVNFVIIKREIEGKDVRWAQIASNVTALSAPETEAGKVPETDAEKAIRKAAKKAAKAAAVNP